MEAAGTEVAVAVQVVQAGQIVQAEVSEGPLPFPGFALKTA